MANDMFTEEELAQAAAIAEEEEERIAPKKKSSMKTFIDPVKFKDDISVNMANLDDAFVTQAALFAHYAMQAAKAAEQVDNVKMLLDVKKAELYNEHREILFKSGAKVTEAMIDAAVITDKRYQRVWKAHNEAKGILEMVKASAEAFRQRRDMIVQIGTNAREERKGEVFIKSREAKEEDLRTRTRRVPNAD